jgi:hypothetical protein
MRRSLLAVPLWISGCMLGSPEPADDSLPLEYHLHFSLNQQDSCSQSWASTTYAGQLTLAVDRREHASLVLEFETRSTGGLWDGDVYDTKEHARCKLLGRADWDGDVLVIAFRYPKRRAADQLPFECRSRRLGSEVPGFELRCAVATLEVGDGPDTDPTRRARVLACQLDENMPVLLASMHDPWNPTWVVALGDERLKLTADADFSGDTTWRYWLESPR